jgi:hypothetical protein
MFGLRADVFRTPVSSDGRNWEFVPDWSEGKNTILLEFVNSSNYLDSGRELQQAQLLSRSASRPMSDSTANEPLHDSGNPRRPKYFPNLRQIQAQTRDFQNLCFRAYGLLEIELNERIL